MRRNSSHTFLYALRRLLTGGIFFLMTLSLYAESQAVPESPKVILNKESIVRIFLENTSLVDAAKQKVAMAEADYKKVLAVYFPDVKFVVGVGPYPKKVYHRSVVYNTEKPDGTFNVDPAHWETFEGDFSSYGFAFRGKVSFVLPIYTFGKFVSGRDATKSLVALKKSEVAVTRLKVKEYALTLYYSWLMAHDIKEMIDTAVSQVNKAEEELQNALYEEKEGVSQKDLIRLRIEKEKLLIHQKKLEYDIKTLVAVFDDVVGQPWRVEDSRLSKVSLGMTETELLSFLRTDSPYMSMAKKGVDARYNLYRYELYKLLPDIGITGYYSVKYTSSVEDSTYPSPNSPYNSTDGEFGIGLRFNLNFLSQYRAMQRAKAEWKATKLQISFMKRKTVIDLKKNVNDLDALDEKIKHLKKARKWAKGWMTMEFSNHESGMGDVKDLIDSVKSFMEQELTLVKTIFDYNMKVEHIKTTAGVE